MDRREIEALREEFVGRKCWCGRLKREREWLCWPCYQALGDELKRGLYKGLGRGLEQAVAAAKKFLEQKQAKGQAG